MPKKVPKKYLVCNCEKTMSLDAAVLGNAIGSKDLPIHTHLCRSQLPEFEAALSSGEDVVVACTQEAPLFSEVASENGYEGDIRFVNIRENGGWCGKNEDANAKIAALLRGATYEGTPTPLKSIECDGLCLVYGSGQIALDLALQLSGKLSVTLVLTDTGALELPGILDVPIFSGIINKAQGSFGSFHVTLDNYAPLLPSSRNELQFAMGRDGVTTQCGLIFDISGGAPLFTGHEKRDGYFRAEPGDPVTIYRKALEASEMVGAFEKPIYVRYDPGICAHSRSQITGCSKCLDLCPAGAITAVGDGVAIDVGICGGCGTCHSSCPTGAVSYNYPNRTDFIKRGQVLIESYLDAGGKQPEILIHEEQYGNDMIRAIARHGAGLPANLLPVSVHSPAMIGHVELGALLAAGAQQIFVLADPKLQDEFSGLKEEIELLNTILTGMDKENEHRVFLLVDADPDDIEAQLRQNRDIALFEGRPFEPVGSKKDVARATFTAMKTMFDSEADIISLPHLAPYGQILIDQESCTLCMACVSACPADAMLDTPGEPRLRFTESSCVQCGLCVNTCPENALTKEPRLNMLPSAMEPITLNEEEPFCCTQCGEAFATRSTIERVQAQLAGKHAMFEDEKNSNLLTMCDNCRIEAQANGENDPFAMGSRPRVRTTQDYLDADQAGLSIDDFLIKE